MEYMKSYKLLQVWYGNMRVGESYKMLQVLWDNIGLGESYR